MKWLKKERINECLQLKSEAHDAGVPLIACFPTSNNTSSRFRHFSVYLGDKQAKPWSALNRTVITCDTETLSFTSKCCGAGFCVHRNVCKWYIKQQEPTLLDTRPAEHEMLTDLPTAPSNTILYPPPDTETKQQMVEYIYQEKKIPSELPPELTIHFNNFKTIFATEGR